MRERQKQPYLPGHLAFHAVCSPDHPGVRLIYRYDFLGGGSGGGFRDVESLILSVVLIGGGDVPVLEGVYGSGELSLHIRSRDPPAGIWHWERNGRGYAWLCITLRVTTTEGAGKEADAVSSQHPVWR